MSGVLAQQYFRAILDKDFKGKDRLPGKVDFAEQYTLPRHMDAQMIDELVEFQRTMDRYLQPNQPRDEAWEAKLREQVMTEFGAHVLQQYDFTVNEQAKKRSPVFYP